MLVTCGIYAAGARYISLSIYSLAMEHWADQPFLESLKMNNDARPPDPHSGEARQVDLSSDPEQLIVQGSEKQFPHRWGCTDEGNRYLAYRSVAVSVPHATIDALVGIKNAELHLTKHAESMALDENELSRQRRLEVMERFLEPIASKYQKSLNRFERTKQKTSRLERYQVGRIELAVDQHFSWAIGGELVVVFFWGTLLLLGIAAEIIVGQFNIVRADLEDMEGPVTWVLAFLPFLGTFATLKWLDPADVDRDRHHFYRWLIRASLVVTPLGMLLFAAKLDALLEYDPFEAVDNSGPPFTWVLWVMQLSFAIAIYLVSLKLTDAWYRLLGYDVRVRREYLEVCSDISVHEDALRSVVEIGARIAGALAAIEARATRAVVDFNAHYAEAEKAYQTRIQLADAAASAAAAQARLEGFRPRPSEEGDREST
jgi:hypothetical protein